MASSSLALARVASRWRIWPAMVSRWCTCQPNTLHKTLARQWETYASPLELRHFVSSTFPSLFSFLFFSCRDFASREGRALGSNGSGGGGRGLGGWRAGQLMAGAMCSSANWVLATLAPPGSPLTTMPRRARTCEFFSCLPSSFSSFSSSFLFLLPLLASASCFLLFLSFLFFFSSLFCIFGLFFCQFIGWYLWSEKESNMSEGPRVPQPLLSLTLSPFPALSFGCHC